MTDVRDRGKPEPTDTSHHEPAVEVTGRPADVAPENSTFAQRAQAAREKAVKEEDAEDKSVKKATSK